MEKIKVKLPYKREDMFDKVLGNCHTYLEQYYDIDFNKINHIKREPINKKQTSFVYYSLISYNKIPIEVKEFLENDSKNAKDLYVKSYYNVVYNSMALLIDRKENKFNPKDFIFDKNIWSRNV